MAHFELQHVKGDKSAKIVARWSAINISDFQWAAGLRLRLMDDGGVVWWHLTPLVDDGGPGLVVDRLAVETGGMAHSFGETGLVAFPAGITTELGAVIIVPGSAEGLAFWERHKGAQLSLLLELLEIDPDSGALRRVAAVHEEAAAILVGEGAEAYRGNAYAQVGAKSTAYEQEERR